MNPRIIKRIEEILKREESLTDKADALAFEFGIEHFKHIRKVRGRFDQSEIDIILNKENLTPNELRKITLFALVTHEEKADLLPVLIERIKAEREKDWMFKQLYINDHHLIDTLFYLTGHDQLERPCPQCPIRKKRT